MPGTIFRREATGGGLIPRKCGLAFLFLLCSSLLMPQGPSLAATAPPIPAFTPVPVRARRDGWTAERQRMFIATLADTGCVGRAALAAGMSRESAYRLRRRKGAESFTAAWDSILAARPRGSSSLALIWHRLVRKHGGRGAVRRMAAAAGWETELHSAPGLPRGPGASGRSQ